MPKRCKARLSIEKILRDYQRWCRGHKARGQDQGHKKNPRPRTALPRTHTFEAKDRNAQGQGPRTQAQVFSKKKVFKFFFQALCKLLVYPEFLIGGGLNHKSHKTTSSKFFQRRNFCGTKSQRYRRMEDLKSLPAGT